MGWGDGNSRRCRGSVFRRKRRKWYAALKGPWVPRRGRRPLESTASSLTARRGAADVCMRRRKKAGSSSVTTTAAWAANASMRPFPAPVVGSTYGW
jgi:hypothetical protein